MSRSGAILIECESDHCYEAVKYDAHDLDNGELAELLAEDGWTRQDGHDYCPVCSKAENPRERGEDDGAEYGHPADAREDAR